MRVLISTWPAHGHLLPLLPVARAAERAGHSVVIASGTEGAAEAARRGFATWDVGPSRVDAEAAFRAAGPDPATVAPELRVPMVIRGMFGAAAFERAEALVPLAEAWHPDLVVHPITELAGAIAAERVGARHVVHGLGPLPAEAWDWFGARFDELCARWGVPDLAADVLERCYLDPCPPLLQDDAVAAFRRRHPLRPTTGDVVPGETLPWDDEMLARLPFDRTVHLTLGTLFHGATHVFETALTGLRELPVNVVVTVGPGNDPDRLGPQPAHVLVADFVPHALLLPHCSALVTQGGSATILAALCLGLPHLIVPQGADQFLNAVTAERAGVAVQLLPPELNAQSVAHAASRVLEDQRIAVAAGRVEAEIATMPSADDVVATLAAA